MAACCSWTNVSNHKSHSDCTVTSVTQWIHLRIGYITLYQDPDLDPDPDPVLDPVLDPDPVQDQDPDPDQNPVLDQDPDPDPVQDQDPDPDQNPVLDQDPDPDPVPDQRCFRPRIIIFQDRKTQ